MLLRFLAQQAAKKLMLPAFSALIGIVSIEKERSGCSRSQAAQPMVEAPLASVEVCHDLDQRFLREDKAQSPKLRDFHEVKLGCFGVNR